MTARVLRSFQSIDRPARPGPDGLIFLLAGLEAVPAGKGNHSAIVSAEFKSWEMEGELSGSRHRFKLGPHFPIGADPSGNH